MKILGEEQEVLDATQQLLTISAHRTLNDPNVLDHSMEFATEVVGDDVVQRTGGEALRNTVGYAVQPSGGAGKCCVFTTGRCMLETTHYVSYIISPYHVIES